MLFGFAMKDEKELFGKLTFVPGVGPKIALAPTGKWRAGTNSPDARLVPGDFSSWSGLRLDELFPERNGDGFGPVAGTELEQEGFCVTANHVKADVEFLGDIGAR